MRDAETDIVILYDLFDWRLPTRLIMRLLVDSNQHFSFQRSVLSNTSHLQILHAKRFLRKHLLRLHPRQPKGRLNLDRRAGTDALASMGRWTATHWLGQGPCSDNRLSIWYFMEALRGYQHWQWYDSGKCVRYGYIASEDADYKRINSIACCQTGNSLATLPET